MRNTEQFSDKAHLGVSVRKKRSPEKKEETPSAYGFMTSGLSNKEAAVLAAAAKDIELTTWLPAMWIGSGIKVCRGDAGQAAKQVRGRNAVISDRLFLDEDTNLIEMEIVTRFDAPRIIYMWALALHHFNFIENYEYAQSVLTTNTITQLEATDRMTARWRNAELAIQTTLESIFVEAEDKAAATRAIMRFHGVIDGEMTRDTTGAMRAIQKLQEDAEDLGGKLDSQHAALLASLVAMRSDASSQIQVNKYSGAPEISTLTAYQFRMIDYSMATGQQSHADLAPATSLAAAICRMSGHEFHTDDSRRNPTDNEVMEIIGRMPVFSKAMTGEIADIEENNTKVGVSNITPEPSAREADAVSGTQERSPIIKKVIRR